ncbi:MAG: FAD:protein FMN transferase [Lachnospiraceae bacterium]|nr:FAD:protein FMN transferase [Lachnospiraceae bacterium]
MVGMKKLCFCLIPILLLCSCSRAAQITEVNGFYFDTYVNITLYEDNVSVKTELPKLLSSLELIYSPTLPESELYRLNHALIRKPESEELRKTLEEAMYYEVLSGGALNASIGSVSALWDFHTDSPAVPDSASVNAALKQIKKGADYLSDRELSLDLGCIAKGAISFRVRDYLLDQGVSSAIIDLGGNVVVIGGKPDGRPFTVGIQDPLAKDKVLRTVQVKDCCVVTSGTYERCFEADGKLYHHILDPQTGYPAESGLSSVTILCADPVMADALSTACMVLGKEEGLALIETIDDCEALFIDGDMNMYPSSGFPPQ